MRRSKKGQADPNYELKMFREPEQATRTKGPRYTPVSKRQDKPDGIAWIIRNHPEVSDGQTGKLIGTTSQHDPGHPRPNALEYRRYRAQGPVTLGLCTQRELDAVVKKAAKLKGIEAQADGKLEGDVLP